MLIKNLISGRTSVLFICVFLANLATGRIIYVDDDAPGANDGSSWADACADLRGVIRDEADSGDTIWVAQGVYRPTGRDGDRGQSFQLKDGVIVEGGYAGFGEPDPDARDIDVYRTILSGDLNADDVDVTDPWDLMDEPTRAENSFHVIECGYTNESTVLDGFTITGGHANGTRTRDENGGGMDINGGSPKIINCTFIGNSTKKCGGGMYNEGGSPKIIDCTFRGNFANKGGGLYNDISSATVSNCTFSKNSASDSGGGMYNDNSDSELLSCRFVGNLSACGGGMFNTEGGPNLTNCIFSGNWAESGGGMLNVYSRPILTNCTFSRNSADFDSGTFNIDADPNFTNCILWHNTDYGRETDELAQIYMEGGTPTINYCCVQGWTGQWPGEGNIHSDPLFVDDDGEDDVVGSQDDDLHLLWNSPCINAGDNNAVPVEVEYDYDGYPNPRICKDVNEVVDMGAFEFCESPGLYKIIYVDVDANGADDGTSWADAFTCLQDALYVAAQYPEVREVRVAKGIYTPAEAYGPPEETFQLISNVAIRGGYAGWGEPEPNAPDIHLDPNTRDINLFETILSGDLNGDDANLADPCDLLTDPNRADNSFHVVTGSGTDASAELDGFTITGGMANGLYGDEDGGGMYIMLGNPNVIRCTFRGNCASGDGGGILCRLSDPSIRNCTISQNFAQFGAGICCLYSWPTIEDNVIEDNNAIGDGGGIYCANQSSPSITDNEIKSNKAGYHGGGICCMYDSDPNILRNNIKANKASVDGGGIYCSYLSDANIINCTISYNTAANKGGGIRIWDGASAIISNCMISYNSPQGFWADSTIVQIDGTVEIVSNDCIGKDLELIGDGTLQIQSDVTLKLDDSKIQCNVSGPGTIKVEFDSELIIEEDAVIDLGHETGPNGRIVCDGLLRAKGNAWIRNANISVTRASFVGDVNISNNVITAEAGAPYGQFFIEDTVTVTANEIHADGDRYMDMDPSAFDGLIADNRIDIKITEGIGGTYGGLFEARGEDRFCPKQPCTPGVFLLKPSPGFRSQYLDN